MSDGSEGTKRPVTAITRPLAMRYALQRVQRLLETGTLRIPLPLRQRMEAHGVSRQDIEYMVAKGRVTELKTKAEDKRFRVYKIVGLTIEGEPAAFTMDVRKGLGVVTRFSWPARRGGGPDEV